MPASLTSPPSSPVAHTPHWAASHQHFLLDLDGTLIHQDTPTHGAAELLRRLDGRYMLVSNNSTDTAARLSLRLHAMGLPVAAERIVLAGQHTVDWVTRHGLGQRLMLVGSATLRRYAREQGCHLVEQAPDCVLLARDAEFSYETLTRTANAVRRGAQLIVTNPDTSHPAANGDLVPETGTLMQAIVACSGRSAASVLGKPGAALFQEGLRRLQARPAHTLVIGDNPATDAAGAVQLEMRYLLVGQHALADAVSPAALLALDAPGHDDIGRLALRNGEPVHTPSARGAID